LNHGIENVPLGLMLLQTKGAEPNLLYQVVIVDVQGVEFPGVRVIKLFSSSLTLLASKFEYFQPGQIFLIPTPCTTLRVG